MADDRVTQIGKQVVWSVPAGVLVTQIGKEVTFPVHNEAWVTQIGKQVVWSDVAPPAPPVPTQVAPAPALARNGTVYVDSALVYDGRNVGATDGLHAGVSVALSGGTTWMPGETLTLTATGGSPFVSGDVGVVLILHQVDPITGTDISTLRFTIAGFTSATVVTGTADTAIPTPIRSGAIAVWDRLVNTVAGLDHIEGLAVGILADEHVVASPYNARLPIIAVASGTVALGAFYSHVIVGLPYFSDLETLDIDQPQGPSIKGQGINISKLGIIVSQSRAVWGGSLPPTNDALNPLQGLQEIPMPTDATYEDYLTEYLDANITSQWTNHGRVFLRSVDPDAANILAIIAMGFIPAPG